MSARPPAPFCRETSGVNRRGVEENRSRAPRSFLCPSPSELPEVRWAGVGCWGRRAMSATESGCRCGKDRGWSRGHWERFPALRCVRGSRDGEVERRERADSLPSAVESLGSEEKRPRRRLHKAEGRARDETRDGPRPGPGGSEGGGGGSWGGWASVRADFTLLRPPRAPQLPDGCSGHRPRRPSSGGEGPVFGVQAPSPSGRTWNCQSPPPPPARCQTPGVSGVRRWEGRAGESTSSLLLATGFVPLARPGAHSVSKVGPHPPGPVVCAVVAVPLIRRKCPLPSRALVGLSAGGRETYYRSY